MASLDNLPADQRAVLQLVLQRGRTYDQIAAMLSIDRAAVRQRAVAAFDALGPQTDVAPEQRALITDYLLGQLPEPVSESTADRLADSPADRAWARVVASELAPLAAHPLPEIPVERGRPQAPRAAQQPAPLAAASEALARPERDDAGQSGGADGRRSSRRGGAILLALLAAVIVIGVVVVIATSGGGAHSSSTAASAAPTTTAANTTAANTTAANTTAANTAGAATTSTASTATTSPQIVGQINLTSPLSSSSAKGAAFVVKRGTQTAIVVQGQSIPANSKHDAYAVWLYNSSGDSHLLGFVNPGVGTNGKLSTAGALPTNAAHFKNLLVTLETQSTPKQPGKIILQGKLTGVS